jgi:fimbrial isopeptide formation D2 family protein/LPXTG-motif cell wall-anchored protein
MKTTKKLLALVMGLVMALALTVTAMAGPFTEHTITITNADPAKTHTYAAYQVFSGTYDNGQLTGINWGTGVNGPALLTALKGDATIGSAFASATSAADVANILEGFGNNSAALDAFALLVGQNLNEVAGTSVQDPEDDNTYIIDVTGDGYYFVKDTSATLADGETYSKYMLKVIEDETIEAKDDHLVPDKNIVEGTDRLKASTAAIGDEITFEVKIPVPKMDGYAAYTFVMHDTLCPGLTFQRIESVTVGSETVYATGTANIPAEDAGQTYSYTAVKDVTTTEPAHTGTNETALTITFDNFIQYKGESGYVTITYVATLNTDAQLVNANPNEVYFTYSNNPSNSGTATPTTGNTPKVRTETFTTSLKLIKKDGTTGEVLEGAKFTLTGKALNIVLVTGEKYERTGYTAAANETIETAGTPAANVVYYELNNHTFTTTAPTDLTKAQYVNTGTPTDPVYPTYVKVTYTKTVVQSTASGEEPNITYNASVITDANGVAVFNGLNVGTYTLTEVIAPNGYNLLKDPINITITWTEAGGFAVTGATMDTTDPDHPFVITVNNMSGATLPSTGGIGTTIFYVLGAILAIGAGVILVTRRRMGDEH